MIIKPARRKQLSKYLIATVMPLMAQVFNPALINVSLGLSALTLLNAEYHRQKSKYLINNNEMVIEEGIINKSRTSIELRNIVQIKVRQGLIERLIGYGDLEVETKSTPIKLINIKHPQIIAKRIKQLLKDKGY